tara:strand:+ start:49716 stop:51806 length:2091 start_codon:yes stop_codon:yes gene_type:complete
MPFNFNQKSLMTLLVVFLSLLQSPTKADGVLCQNRDILSTTQTDSNASEVIVIDSIAYVRVTYFGLHIYDVQNPQAPVLLSTYQTPGSAFDFVVQDNHAYIADGSNRQLHIVDVSDPSNPTYAATHFMPDGRVGAVAISGTTLCVAKNSSSTNAPRGYDLLDISDPTNPVLLRRANSSARIIEVHMIDEFMYFLLDINYPNPDRLEIYEISNPSNIQFLSSYTFTGHNYTRFLEVIGDYAYVGALYDSGTAVLDISNKEQPTLVRFIDDELPTGMQAANDHLFIYHHGGIQIYDTKDPVYPVFVRSFDTPFSVRDIQIIDNVTYAVTSFGLHAIDTSDLSHQPSPIISTTPIPDPASLVLQDSTAYIASGEAGLLLVDVSTTSTPAIVGQFDSPGYAHKSATVNNTTYLADGHEGLHILDTSDKSNPSLISTLNPEGAVTDLAIDGDTLYIVGGTATLQIYNIQDNQNPISIGSFISTDTISKIEASNNIAIILAGNSHGYALNTSDPSNVTVQWERSFLPATDIEFSENEVVILWNNDGGTSVTVLDIQDPLNVYQVPSGSTQLEIIAKDHVGQMVGLLNSETKLHVLDQNDGFSSLPLGWADLTINGLSRARDIAVAGNKVYIIDELSLKILNIEDCPPCTADINDDGALNTLDISSFIAGFNSTQPFADFTNDGSFNFFDVSAFLLAFSAGCP